MFVLGTFATAADFRLWHLADIDADSDHVSYWRAKRTSIVRARVFANDPLRTSPELRSCMAKLLYEQERSDVPTQRADMPYTPSDPDIGDTEPGVN